MIDSTEKQKVLDQIGQLWDKHEEGLDAAFTKNPGKLNVHFLVKFEPTKDGEEGRPRVETAISAATDRIRDKVSEPDRQMTLDEAQGGKAPGSPDGGEPGSPAGKRKLHKVKG